MRHAATPWAPPTAEQIGLIGTHWSKGWIIENNVISHSICSGIALGKYGDQWDNTSANTAEGYVKTIERGPAKNGWNKETIGHHIVRNNTISHCEQAGIVGSLGAVFSVVTGNTIHDIHVRQLFAGAEMAGIKFHAAIDCRDQPQSHLPHLPGTLAGLDGPGHARVRATCSTTTTDRICSSRWITGRSGGQQPLPVPRQLAGHVRGRGLRPQSVRRAIVSQPERSRATPYHPAHSTAVAGLVNIKGGDDRFYNNLFISNGGDGADAVKAAPQHSPRGAGSGLWAYDPREAPVLTGGNVFHHGARPYRNETSAVVKSDFDPKLAWREVDGKLFLSFQCGPEPDAVLTNLVDTAGLGKTMISRQAYENADGTPLRVDTDFFGKPRDASPAPGPFENPTGAKKGFVVWDTDGITRPVHPR